jgi:Zn-dependent M28 family amino/carboxypeptidase
MPKPNPHALTDLASRLHRHVDMLAGVIGERNVPHRYGALEATARYIEDTLTSFGYAPTAQEFPAYGKPVRNIECEIVGRKHPRRIWIVGAHYDSIDGSPAADDNASAVAGVLEVARLLAGTSCRDTVRFVAFVNEEPPFYKGPEMGSTVYAKRCRERDEDIRGMINLEMIGYYRDERGTQDYPLPLGRPPWKWLLPTRGDFIAFVGNFPSFWLTRRCKRLFRRSVRFPALWVAAPNRIDGTGMSDHWSFWQQGYPAVMVTDTAFFRNPHYHKPSDTPDKLDYPRMAQVTTGLAGMLRRLAGG